MKIIKILIDEKLASLYWWWSWKIIKTRKAQQASTVKHNAAVNRRLSWCAENIYNASDWHGVNVDINGECRTVKFNNQ